MSISDSLLCPAGHSADFSGGHPSRPVLITGLRRVSSSLAAWRGKVGNMEGDRSPRPAFAVHPLSPERKRESAKSCRLLVAFGFMSTFRSRPFMYAGALGNGAGGAVSDRTLSWQQLTGSGRYIRRLVPIVIISSPPIHQTPRFTSWKFVFPTRSLQTDDRAIALPRAND